MNHRFGAVEIQGDYGMARGRVVEVDHHAVMLAICWSLMVERDQVAPAQGVINRERKAWRLVQAGKRVRREPHAKNLNEEPSNVRCELGIQCHFADDFTPFMADIDGRGTSIYDFLRAIRCYQCSQHACPRRTIEAVGIALYFRQIIAAGVDNTARSSQVGQSLFIPIIGKTLHFSFFKHAYVPPSLPS